MADFYNLINGTEVVVFDGAIGTMLQEAGMDPGLTPEAYAMSHPEAIRDLHASYLKAGAQVVTTNTFGGTRHKLGPDVGVKGFNRRMAELAREAVCAVGADALVAGSVGPTGYMAPPLGDLPFAEMTEAFREQIEGLVEGGADFILAETHYDLAEVRAAVVAARQVCDLPVGASMTFEGAQSLTGTPPEVFVDSMQNMGVALVSVNCSAGPQAFYDLVEAMALRLEVPLVAYPNAGLPELVDGRARFPQGPDEFAEKAAGLVDHGASCVGGCCGTTPDHIRALRRAVQDKSRPRPKPSGLLALTSRSSSTLVGHGMPCRIIGERINPTGKKALTAELQAGQFGQALTYAAEQIDAGAAVLDVNVGAPMVDEPELLPRLAATLVERFDPVLCIDSSDPRAIEPALQACPGTVLVNSISGEEGRMEELGPLCKLYGAPFILLPLAGKSLPATAAERIAIVERLLGQADELGIPRRLVMVDVLALTVSSKADAARHCLSVLRWCRDRNIPTVCGLSNISYGLPARELVNSAFAAMALEAGLTAVIANPGSARLRQVMAASEVLLARDPQAGDFIRDYSEWKPGEPAQAGPAGGGTGRSQAETVEEAVILGDKERLPGLVEQALVEGAKPYQLVADRLVPAITTVGEKYERKEYYLPQLILSAETMQLAFSQLKPLLEAEESGEEKPVVIMATVEGDIHDIGKNIVILMLRNHGYEVVDLGRDVKAGEIVDAAEQHDAALIGLSALMTTTMVKMEETVKLTRQRGLAARILVGGAVVSDGFAQSIGADGYAADAVAAVRLADSLTGRGGQAHV